MPQLSERFKIAVCATLILSLVITLGCGDDRLSTQIDSRTDDERRIIASEASFTTDDLISIGLKSGKQYDVSTLPGGIDARLMYWRVEGTPVEYEARFYASHAEAIELGAAPAEEGSGADAVLDSDNAEYVEGIRDRRTIFDFRAAPKPKYGAYGIYGNMVVLCEGRDDEEGWRRCSALIDELSEAQ